MPAVEVVYALPGKEDVSSMRLPHGSNLKDALEASGVLQRHPEIELALWKFGIFGKAASLETPLAEGDRVEIYRPLAMDPKEARRRRAAAAAQDSRRAASEKKKRSV